MTEKQKYLNYVEGQRALGLKHSYLMYSLDYSRLKIDNEEEIYAELNRMIAAPDIKDKEVLGRHSL